MAQLRKLENVVEVDAQPDKFYSILRNKMYKLSSITSDVHKGELQKGDWETVGSVKSWDYSLEGESLNVKETVEKIDDENKLMIFRALDGDLLKLYKRFKVTFQVIPKSRGSAIKWTIEYEKLNENVPAPDAYMEFAAKVTREIDAHLSNA